MLAKFQTERLALKYESNHVYRNILYWVHIIKLTPMKYANKFSPKKWISLSEIHAFLKFECIINFYRLRCMMFHKRDNKGKWWWKHTWDSACSRYFCTKKTKKKTNLFNPLQYCQNDVDVKPMVRDASHGVLKCTKHDTGWTRRSYQHPLITTAGGFKAYRDSVLISLRRVTGEVLFESSPGDSNVQLPMRITGLDGYSDS